MHLGARFVLFLFIAIMCGAQHSRSQNIQYSIAEQTGYFMVSNPDINCTYQWSFSNGQTTTIMGTGSQIIYEFPSEGPYRVYLATVCPPVDTAWQDVNIILKCVLPKAAYLSSSTNNIVQFDNRSRALISTDTFIWEYQYSAMIKDTFPGDSLLHSHVFPPLPPDTSYNVRLIAANDCGRDTVEYKVYLDAGYVEDLPKKLNPCIAIGKHTPISWLATDSVFPLDDPSNPNGIDDALDNWNNTYHPDIVIYYSIPPGASYTSVIDSISDIFASNSIPYELGINRYDSDFLTVTSAEDVPIPVLSQLSSLYSVHFIQSNEPINFLPTPTTLPSNAQYVGEVGSTMQMHSTSGAFGMCTGIPLIENTFPNINATGLGVSITLLGSGFSPHISNYGIDIVKTATVSGPGPVDLSGSIDDNGHGTAILSLLAGYDPSGTNQFKGMLSLPEIRQYKVLDGMGNARPMDIVHAIDDIIQQDNTQILASTIDSDQIDNGMGFISQIYNVVAFFGILPIVGAGIKGSLGITAPGASTMALTAGYLDTDVCNAITTNGFDTGQGMNLGLRHQKPEISAYGGNTLAADNSTLHYSSISSGSATTNTRSIYGPSVAVALVASTAAIICTQNFAMRAYALQRLLILSAENQNLPPGSQWNQQNGYGKLTAYNALSYYEAVAPPDKINIGFTEHTNSPGFAQYLSHDIMPVGGSELTAGFPKTVRVVVTNFSATDYDSAAHRAVLSLRVHQFSNSVQIGEKVAAIEIPDIPANDDVTCSLTFDPLIDMECVCLRVWIEYPYDSLFEDDSASKNCYLSPFPAVGDTLEKQVMLVVPGGKELWFDSLVSITGSGIDYSTSFVPNTVHADTFNNTWVTYKFWRDPSQTATVTVEFNFSFEGAIGLDTFDLSGFNFTFDSTLVSRASPAPAIQTAEFRLASNPTKDIATLIASTEKALRLNIGIADIHGRILKTIPPALISPGERREFPLDLSGFADGIYIIRILTGKESIFKKVIKM